MPQYRSNQLKDTADDALIELMEALAEIDEHQQQADVNETSISGSNGIRINF